MLLAVMIQREMTRLGCWWMMMMRGTTFIGESYILNSQTPSVHRAGMTDQDRLQARAMYVYSVQAGYNM